jgi:hypothetical protein
MKEQLYEGRTPSEKLQLLTDNCASKEQQLVKVYFSEDDLAEMKSRLSEHAIQEDDLKDELKELSAGLRARIKEQSATIKGLLRYIKDKYEEQLQDVFHFDDQENGLMLTYNCEGALINSRRLRPNERQTSIRNLNNKTA